MHDELMLDPSPLDHRLMATVAQALRLDASELHSTTAFRDLAVWDSFAALAVLYGIEDDFGVQIGYGALDCAVTLGDLQALITERIARAGAASPRRRTP